MITDADTLKKRLVPLLKQAKIQLQYKDAGRFQALVARVLRYIDDPAPADADDDIYDDLDDSTPRRRRVVQLVPVALGTSLFSLCDDGSIWVGNRQTPGWQRIDTSDIEK